MLALGSVLGLKYVACAPHEPDCEHAALDNDINVGLVVCRNEYLATNDPTTGVLYANLLRRSGQPRDAESLANNLVATSARADALQVLGKIEIAEGRSDEGRALLEKARELHVTERRLKQIAVDDQALAGIHREQKHFAEALRVLESCITRSSEANARVIEGYCRMSAGLVLSEVGFYDGASEQLSAAERLLELDRDLGDLAIERGTLELRNGFGPRRLGNTAVAVQEFKRAIKHASAASLTRVRRKAELNLVYALAELSDARPELTDEASAHLAAARDLDLDGSEADVRSALQARIAYRRKDYALASSINADVFKKLTDPDQRLRVAVMQAEIGLAIGVLDDAIRWANQGIDIAEAMREEPAIELRPWILSARRQSNELLFIALARAHRFEDAVCAFDHCQGRTLLDQLARGGSESLGRLPAAATHTDVVSRYESVLSHARVMVPADRETLLAELRNIDLIALFVASDELWRITARHGQLDIEDLGPLADLVSELNAFRSHPTRVELGNALGVRLLGREPFRKTDETLFILLDGDAGGEIASLPVAALRVDGEPLIAMRPVVRPARLSELACIPPQPPRRLFAIADARGDLRDTRRVVSELATKSGFTAAIGSSATETALFTAAADDHLLIAVHASIQPGGGSLELYDRSVPALEISGRRNGLALVFLAACSSATSNDGELSTSLATAFLASGAQQVIATLRPVRDPGAAEIVDAFYAADGLTDPARALARVQANLSHTENTDWPNFVLYGHDICRKGLQ